MKPKELMRLLYLRMNLLYYIVGPQEERAAAAANPPRTPRFTRTSRRKPRRSLQDEKLLQEAFKAKCAVTVTTLGK